MTLFYSSRVRDSSFKCIYEIMFANLCLRSRYTHLVRKGTIRQKTHFFFFFLRKEEGWGSLPYFFFFFVILYRNTAADHVDDHICGFAKVIEE